MQYQDYEFRSQGPENKEFITLHKTIQQIKYI